MRGIVSAGKLSPVLGLIVVGLLLSSYNLDIAEQVIIYAILGLGLNIFMGLAGQANFGVSGFAAIGAFGSGLMTVKWGINPLLTVIPTVALGSLVALLLSSFLLRLRDMSLAIGTIAFALAVYSFLESVLPLNWGGGGNGLIVPSITFWGWNPGPKFFYYYAAAWLVLIYIGYRRLERSRIGRAWRAIGSDEVAASASGINCRNYKQLAFVLNSAVAVLAGTLLVQQNGFASAGSYGIFSNLTILLVVIIGGVGSAPGAMLGALLLVILGQVTSGIQTFPIFVEGAILFIVIRFLPRGLWYYLEVVARMARDRVIGATNSSSERETSVGT
jgi:branched-chain amino acid transport system permease protein